MGSLNNLINHEDCNYYLSGLANLLCQWGIN